MDKPEFKRKMIKDLKWGLVGMGIIFVFTSVLLPALALAYSPIEKYYYSIHKTITVSGIYVFIWTVFRLFYFITEEIRLYLDRSIKELLLITMKVIKIIFILPLAIYPMTVLMLYMTDHIRDEGIQTIMLVGCIYLWNYIFFRTTAYLDTRITETIF